MRSAILIISQSHSMFIKHKWSIQIKLCPFCVRTKNDLSVWCQCNSFIEIWVDIIWIKAFLLPCKFFLRPVLYLLLLTEITPFSSLNIYSWEFPQFKINNVPNIMLNMTIRPLFPPDYQYISITLITLTTSDFFMLFLYHLCLYSSGYNVRHSLTFCFSCCCRFKYQGRR